MEVETPVLLDTPEFAIVSKKDDYAFVRERSSGGSAEKCPGKLSKRPNSGLWVIIICRHPDESNDSRNCFATGRHKQAKDIVGR